MTILCGLTSTRFESTPRFLEDAARLNVKALALFPTCLDPMRRQALYRELERLPGMRLPHVHLRSDFSEGEMDYLIERFGTEVFNAHPKASRYSHGTIPVHLKRRVFMENVEIPPTEEESAEFGGLCPDFSHLENARLCNREAYVDTMTKLLQRFSVGCCHISALAYGRPNAWAGEWDHHSFLELSDFDYLDAYFPYFPSRWASLELENPLEDQLRVLAYIAARFRQA